jgi:hypothetical protein
VQVRALLLFVLLAASGCGGDESARPAVGAVDDAVRSQPALVGELVDSGFGAIAVTSVWEPGLRAPRAEELGALRAVATEAEQADVRLIARLYHAGSSTTPLTDAARDEFASYAAALVRTSTRSTT